MLTRDGEKGVWRWGKRETVYLLLYCHDQNDFCIKMGSDENHLNVLLIVRDKATGQCPQTTTFEEKGEAKQIQTRVTLLTSLMPYCCATPAHIQPQRVKHLHTAH